MQLNWAIYKVCDLNIDPHVCLFSRPCQMWSGSANTFSTARGLSATQREAYMRSLTTQKPKRLPRVVMYLQNEWIWFVRFLAINAFWLSLSLSLTVYLADLKRYVYMYVCIYVYVYHIYVCVCILYVYLYPRWIHDNFSVHLWVYMLFPASEHQN